PMAILRPLFITIILLFLRSAQAAAQGGVSRPPQSKPESQPGAHTAGMATSGVYGAIKDKQGRPITAGGFVESGPVIFQDITAKAGLASFHHQMGTPEKKLIIDAVGY